MREACAVAIFLISWKYFLKNKWLKYYFCVFLAILFHISAVILILLPILYKIKFINKIFHFGKSFWVSCIILLIGGSIILSRFFDVINLIQIASIQEASDAYSQSDHYGGEREMSLFRYLTYFFKFILYPFLAFYFLRHYAQDSNKYWNLPNFYSKFEFAICFYIYLIIASIFIYIIHRFSNYFSIFTILILSEVIFSKFKDKNKKISLSLGIWFLLILPFTFPTINGYLKYDEDNSFRLINVYYPYNSIIDQEINREREAYYQHIGKFR